ncbi:hypothetical protein [Microcystis aeruginosa]|uniref:hypothetical protein n=1 Tax=Microcystis aeruginosa TaxID=1126 RepID=UPI001C0F37E8|nr:hypothetical protein [Microcystis aeruginosa]
MINGCYISIINWVEVLSKIVDLGESPEEIIGSSIYATLLRDCKIFARVPEERYDS